MKQLLLPFLALLFLMGCEKESTTELQHEQEVYENGSATTRGNKRDVCHNGNIININVNAIPAHQAHGDAVDMDEDGYFDIDNPCSETDCDDTTYDPENSCCGEGYEIEFEGPLFVAAADEPGTYNWLAALEACANKEGCDWYLPSAEELNAMFLQLGPTNYGGSGDMPDGRYWSSTETDATFAISQIFIAGNQNPYFKGASFRCRCVRR